MVQNSKLQDTVQVLHRSAFLQFLFTEWFHLGLDAMLISNLGVSFGLEA